MKKVTIIIIAILVVCLSSYFIFDKVIKKNVDKENCEKETAKDKEKTNQNNDIKYTYLEEENGDIVFYKDGDVISKYKCDGIACKVDWFDGEVTYSSKTPETYIFGDKVLIANCDGVICAGFDEYGGLHFVNSNWEGYNAYGKVLLYDIPTGKIYKEYDNVYSIMRNGSDNSIKVLRLLNNENVIISKDGTIDRKFNYDDYIFNCYEGCNLSEYIYNKNVIIYKQKEKYGIQRLDDGEIILNATYDDMSFAGEKYYIAKLNDKYNLYNLQDNELITKNGYDRIFFVNDELLLVYKDKEISFINLKEEKLTNDTIHVDNICPWLPKNPLGIRVEDYDNDNIYTIYISDGLIPFENMTEYYYTFNLNTYELTNMN